MPLWEYESADQQQGELVTYKAGYFVHRSPGSIHGFEPGPTSPIGAVVLNWRWGSGTLIGEQDFETETVEVPYS